MFSLSKCGIAFPTLSRAILSARNKSSIIESLASSRSLIRVSGTEVAPFLQGLITNDINHVSQKSAAAAMYTMFLNKPGRILYESIIYKLPADENALYIECDRTVSAELRKHLLLFRVRKKIDVDIADDSFRIWTVFPSRDFDQMKKSAEKPDTPNVQDIIRFQDPRCAALGTRIFASADITRNRIRSAWPENEIAESTDEYDYAQHRYNLGIGEGVHEVPAGKCFPFEANCDFLHGISFHKGCYLGQEFTARTYHTGVIRKRLMPIEFNSAAPQTTEFKFDSAIVDADGNSVGKLRGRRNRFAIGLLRVDQALGAKVLRIDGAEASTRRPFWWPTIASETK